ncbi:hypothetical protein CBF45_04000 [Bordetella sp. J329]|jgi:hypothetical protein|uniref:Uncharacterized protein n=1 Tax=Kerstersia gyiorum TaxID=206506 RepID=A0A171KRF0_9BURK|nr:hypothetical protein CBF45_04000 [Bordetella sp. J329]KKO71467.1 hypothetical protein AAV32_11570 [Kerstersia gyiorum]
MLTKRQAITAAKTSRHAAFSFVSCYLQKLISAKNGGFSAFIPLLPTAIIPSSNIEVRLVPQPVFLLRIALLPSLACAALLQGLSA